MQRLLTELKRRKVYKVAVAYGIASWLLVEVSSVVFPALLLPDWTLRLAVVFALLGFPLVVALAWVFDITPKGIERTSEVDAASDKARQEQFPTSRRYPPAIEEAIASVAVLPFDDLSPNAEHPGLAEGVATEIHTSLSKLHRIRVASRRSSFRFRDRDISVEDVADALNVRYVISGSLMQTNGRARLNVELDDAIAGAQIWAHRYELDLDDILTVLPEVAEAIVGAFGGERLRSEILRAREQPTENLDAWSLVQRARAYILDYSRQSMDDAESLLNRAIELDSGYAAAHAALGSVLSERVLNGLSSDVDADQQHARAAVERALALTPRDPFVLKMSGMVWAAVGDPTRAIETLRSSVDVAPFDFGAWGYLGWPLVARGEASDLSELHQILDRVLELAPEHPGAAFWLHHKSVAYTCEQALDSAEEYARRAVDRHPDLSWGWLNYANVLGLQGRAEQAGHAAARAAQINPAMTPAHYVERIRAMSIVNEVSERRVAGLLAAGLAGRSMRGALEALRPLGVEDERTPFIPVGPDRIGGIGRRDARISPSSDPPPLPSQEVHAVEEPVGSLALERQCDVAVGVERHRPLWLPEPLPDDLGADAVHRRPPGLWGRRGRSGGFPYASRPRSASRRKRVST